MEGAETALRSGPKEFQNGPTRRQGEGVWEWDDRSRSIIGAYEEKYVCLLNE